MTPAGMCVSLDPTVTIGSFVWRATDRPERRAGQTYPHHHPDQANFQTSFIFGGGLQAKQRAMGTSGHLDLKTVLNPPTTWTRKTGHQQKTIGRRECSRWSKGILKGGLVVTSRHRCQSCRKRKSKCSRLQPCSQCEKYGMLQVMGCLVMD